MDIIIDQLLNKINGPVAIRAHTIFSWENEVPWKFKKEGSNFKFGKMYQDENFYRTSFFI